MNLEDESLLSLGARLLASHMLHYTEDLCELFAARLNWKRNMERERLAYDCFHYALGT